MKDLNKMHQQMKNYYMEASLTHQGDEAMKQSVQTLIAIILFFENSLSNEYIIRDTRNLIFDLIKDQPSKESKKLVKGFLKIIK